jgi:hypothetical protein
VIGSKTKLRRLKIYFGMTQQAMYCMLGVGAESVKNMLKIGKPYACK